MSKFIQVLSIILIIFSLFISFYSVYASDANMNLVSNQTNNSLEDNDTIADTGTPTSSSVDDMSITPTGTSSISEDGLSISNILNILLITVGILLILLAIAIIIRLK